MLLKNKIIAALIIATCSVALLFAVKDCSKDCFILWDCQPPYFLYEASLEGRIDKRYIAVGVSSSEFSELRDVSIKVKLPDGVEIVSFNTGKEKISFDKANFVWNIDHVSREENKGIFIPGGV